MNETYISNIYFASTNMTTSVSRFLVNGSKIEVRFVDSENPEHHRWYCGVVKTVRYGTDANGSFAECDVLYEDGEKVKEHRFYDDDFGDELWKFETPLSNLIKDMKDKIEELECCSSDYDPVAALTARAAARSLGTP